MKTEAKTETPKSEPKADAKAETKANPFGFDPAKMFAAFDPTKPFGGFDPTKPFGGFDPMAYFAASQDVMRTAVANATAAATSFAEKYATLDPMAYWTSFRDAMTGAQQWTALRTAMTSAHEQANAASEQYAKIEAQLVERAQAAVSTWAQLAHDAIAYGAQLSAEARKLGVEAMRKGASA
jgi:hypothetical protein